MRLANPDSDLTLAVAVSGCVTMWAKVDLLPATIRTTSFRRLAM